MFCHLDLADHVSNSINLLREEVEAVEAQQAQLQSEVDEWGTLRDDATDVFDQAIADLEAEEARLRSLEELTSNFG